MMAEEGTVVATAPATSEADADAAAAATAAEDQVATGDQDSGTGDEPAKGDQQKTDDKSTDAVSSDADEGAAGAPEAYADFSLPEGMELDSTVLEQAVPVFKELGLSQDQAQKLIDFEAQRVQASQDAQVESFNQLKQDWLTQAKSDDEIGGEKFDENVADAKSFIDAFGTPELKTLLNEYGVGNHPEIIRAFARAGKLVKEDSPGNGGQAPGQKQDRADILYPKN